MSFQSIQFRNGIFFTESRLFFGSSHEGTIPATYRDFERSDPLVQRVFDLLERYVGNFQDRMRLVNMVRQFLVGRCQPAARLQTIQGWRLSGKNTFQKFLKLLLGDRMVQLPRVFLTDGQDSGDVNDAIETLTVSNACVLYTNRMPDSESTFGIETLLSRGISILFFTDDDDQYWNDDIIHFVDPPINFDSLFNHSAPSSIEEQDRNRNYPIDINFDQTIATLASPFVWVVCNLSETEF
jgi:hypothetical protein